MSDLIGHKKALTFMFSDHSWHFLRLIGSFAEPPLAAIKKDKLFGSMEMKFSNFQLQRKMKLKNW